MYLGLTCKKLQKQGNFLFAILGYLTLKKKKEHMFNSSYHRPITNVRKLKHMLVDST
jgi:hypothetical protein